MNNRIFVTGGAGYIGSHFCVEILKKNYELMVFDSLINGSEEALRRVELLTNKKIKLVVGDIRNKKSLNDAMQSFKPTSVIHFAGLKSVAESFIKPLFYYNTNVQGSINLLQTMNEVGCNEIIFSSSATVYDNKILPPYSETDAVGPVSPYGRSKLMFENILSDWANSQKAHKAVILRYFNPVGAHSSGFIGEDPQGAINNLMPLIAQVAQKRQDFLPIFGNDYDTKDGTGERDYIHVTDLALGHVKALENIDKLNKTQVLNLGTGFSTSVKELKEIFEKINKVSIPSKVVGRRSGDVSRSYADPGHARKLLSFECKKTIAEMCADTWNWQTKNPKGYKK